MAKDDTALRRYFQGVFAADRLPTPPQINSQANRPFIVNTDPAGEPGQHWLAMLTKSNCCEIFDGYGPPLTVYKNPDLHEWWKE